MKTAIWLLEIHLKHRAWVILYGFIFAVHGLYFTVSYLLSLCCSTTFLAIIFVLIIWGNILQFVSITSYFFILTPAFNIIFFALNWNYWNYFTVFACNAKSFAFAILVAFACNAKSFVVVILVLFSFFFLLLFSGRAGKSFSSNFHQLLL